MSKFQKYLIFSVLVALVNGLIVLWFFTPRYDHTDTPQYVGTIKYLAGHNGSELSLAAILKPFSLITGVALLPWLEPAKSLLFQNFIFYVLSALFVFLLVNKLYQNEKQAFYGAVLYVLAYPVLAYGLAELIDMPGWFFYLLAFYLALLFLESPSARNAFFIGFIGGAGMLFKEYLGAFAIFFSILLFLQNKFSLKNRIKWTIVFAAGFLAPFLAYNLVIYFTHSFSSIHWYLANWNYDESGSLYVFTPLRILIESVRVFMAGWIFVLLGLAKELKLVGNQRRQVLLALIFPSFSFLVWSWPHNRMMFVAAPYLFLLGSFGLLRNFQNRKTAIFAETGLLFLYILVNYAALEFFLRYGPILQPRGTLFG